MFRLFRLFRSVDRGELTPKRARALASRVQGDLVALAIVAADRLLREAAAD